MSFQWILRSSVNAPIGSSSTRSTYKLAKKLRKPLHSLSSSLQSNPSKPSPTRPPPLPPPPANAPPLPRSALTQSGQRGVPRDIRPTVGREVHHSQDTRSTHKTQSRKEESRDKGRDWTHSRHQRGVITANAVSSWEGGKWQTARPPHWRDYRVS